MAYTTTTRADGTQVTLGGLAGDYADQANDAGLVFDPTAKANVETNMVDITQITHTPQEVVIQPPVDEIIVTPATDTIDLSNAETQQLTVTDSNGEVRTASDETTYTTSDATKATVSTGGLVSPVGVGSATITATFRGKTDTCVVTVIA